MSKIYLHRVNRHSMSQIGTCREGQLRYQSKSSHEVVAVAVVIDEECELFGLLNGSIFFCHLEESDSSEKSDLRMALIT